MKKIPFYISILSILFDTFFFNPLLPQYLLKQISTEVKYRKQELYQILFEKKTTKYQSQEIVLIYALSLHPNIHTKNTIKYGKQCYLNTQKFSPISRKNFYFHFSLQ